MTIARDATLKNCVRFLEIGCVLTSQPEIANFLLRAATYVRHIRVSIEGTKIRGDDETEVGASSQDFYFFAYVNKLVIDVR